MVRKIATVCRRYGVGDGLERNFHHVLGNLEGCFGRMNLMIDINKREGQRGNICNMKAYRGGRRG